MSPYVSQGNSALWLLTLWRCNRRQQSLIAVPRSAIRASLIPVGRHPRACRRPGPRKQNHPAAAVYGCILLVLVLLLVAIWGFGGLQEADRPSSEIPPGTLFTTGPYEFRFSEATAQHKKKYDGTLYWEIVMIGEGRTTGNESISPTAFSDSGMFFSKDDASQQVKLFDKAQGPFLAVGVPRTAAIAY